MRYCKYFIAKFNEAAVLHLDFWDICICQLHTADCNEAIWQTLIHFYSMGQVYASNLNPVVHADQKCILDYSVHIQISSDDYQ